MNGFENIIKPLQYVSLLLYYNFACDTRQTHHSDFKVLGK